jgi:Alginate export
MFARFCTLLLLCFSWTTSMAAHAQSDPVEPRPAFQPFRYDEDWSFLADSSRSSDWLDRLKYISLGREDWYTTIGGEIRERYEHLDQPNFGTGPEDKSGYFLQRYLLSSDFHFGSRIRAFSELQSGLENGRNGGPRPTDLDRLDVHQAFLDWRIFASKGNFVSLRFGRQELGFGSGRLISPAEGLNTRRSLDGTRLTIKIGSIVWNATNLRLVKSSADVFDDVPDHTQTEWGTGMTAPHPVWKKANMSLYYFGLDRKSSIYRKGLGREIRQTIGSRSFKTSGGWDFNYEGILQWGSFAGKPIRAWALSEDTGYTFKQTLLRPRIGFRSDIATGDRGPSSHKLGSFNPLFPAAPVYSGPSGILGPTNLIDITPSLRLQFGKAIMTLESSSFWRESRQDGIYSPSVAAAPPVRRGDGSQARYVASAPSVTIGYQATRHVFVSTIYTHFMAGDFLRESPPARDVNYVASWVSYRF